MLIKNLHIKSLLLALISLNVGYTYATGIIDISSDATSEEISEAKEMLETPTLQSESSYYLEEIVGDVEESSIVITKYCYNSDDFELSEIKYNVVFNECFGNSAGDTSIYYKWAQTEDGNIVLSAACLEDADIEYRYSTSSNTNSIAVERVASYMNGADINENFINFSYSSAGGAIYTVDSSIGNIEGDFINNSSTVSSGGAIYNFYDSVIGHITGNFINNSAGGYGGAIFNYSYSTIGDISGNFIGNSSVRSGAAIYNDKYSTIGNITGDFIANEGYYTIFNYQGSDIGDITGSFINNKGSCIYNSSSSIGDVTGNFIGNEGECISSYYGSIGNITGDFIGNSSEGAIIHLYTTGTAYENIINITGDYIANSSEDGVLYLYDTDDTHANVINITGDFIGNSGGSAIYSHANIGSIVGDFVGNKARAIYNLESIGSIVGDFVGNSSTGGGGAISNSGIIESIVGDFVGNSSTGGGGAISNSGIIESIVGDFVGNSSTGGGGAISNHGTIESIAGDFVGNSSTSSGGAIYNYGQITEIRGNFEDVYVNSDIAWCNGGAISNNGEITVIDGDFKNVSVYVSSGEARGGAIYSWGKIVSALTSDFVNCCVVSSAGAAYGGAIWNAGEISEISVVFDNVYASANDGYSGGGAIYNGRDIDLITNDIVGAYAFSSSSTSSYGAYGGAIYNWKGSIAKISGSFIANNAISTTDTLDSNTASAYGGAICNYYSESSIGEISGDFIANSVSATASSFFANANAYGGAIYNYLGNIGNISSSFLGNYAVAGAMINHSALGGAIYNLDGIMQFATNGKDIAFTGNYVESGSVKTSNAIYNYSSASAAMAIIYMDAYDSSSVIVNDGIDGGTDYVSNQIISINSKSVEGAEYPTVAFNNTVSNQTIYVMNGTLELGEYAGGTITLTGVDANEDGVDDTMNVDASSALLSNATLMVMAGGIVETKADYLGSGNVVNNLGTLNINGGTLSQTIVGIGTINISQEVTIASGTLSVAANSTLNNYGTVTGNLAVASGSDVNAIITWDNLGETIFNGSISGITTMDVSFDLSLDLNDVVGTTTTVYSNTSNDITLSLVDSDHISGARVVGNTVVVDNKIEVTTDDYTATVTKDGDATNIEVTTGSFDIADGEKQTLSSITTAADATVKVTGGTLVTDTELTLGNDEATSGVIAESGVIESTATVQLSEGTTSVTDGKSLELKAAVILADDTQATLKATNGSLILQKDVTLGSNSVLTLGGNVSGSANIIGNGTATINYTGTFSPGNSPELVSYKDISVNYEAKSVLVMEIFGEAGAGVEGGHDKIVFDGCGVSFDGTIQLSIDDVAALVGGDEDVVLTFDLFDFDGASSVLTEGEFVLVYNSSDWVITANTDSLYTTGEVSLSFVSVPEPSTATLSLLALAGMLARRRRKAA